ncbi:sigma-70 family RNA polymerase sigma factor [Leptothoe spongobia]|uniref:Sigma-70 family RNA polymerase sigma factor n=1 Tax=Leptothoe spongobia TAU-MAC 1115 TaxID=1967444 RepID=A0A947DIU8_9CYAN|nr:sigma-70 family RNA polymerase sigma factor [Leptothoe spongobia]MBT9317250.1 sigma-70 family RNA polymerase sigma factor [Leptothoe spongobia TAU-MAC 1115]
MGPIESWEDTASEAMASDADLLASLRAGQVESLRTLYQRYGRLVYTLSRRILHSDEEAEEITQDVFLTLWKKDAYQANRGSLSRYLVVLARSRSIDKLRSQTSHRQRLNKWHLMMADVSPTPLDMATLTERGERTRQALASLSDKERQVIESAYYEGLSQSEIAQRFNIPLGTVKSRSRQALRKLRQTLETSL